MARTRGYLPLIVRAQNGIKASGSAEVVLESEGDGMFAVEFLAELAPLPEDSLGSVVALVDETDAAYRFFPGDASSTDGWTVIAGNGGRWRLIGDQISLAPLGGGADDWPRLLGPGGAAAAMSGKGKLVMRAGTWSAQTAQDVPSQIVIEGSPGVRVVSTMPDTGGDTAVFRASATLTGEVDTDLASDSFSGARQIDVIADIPVGRIVQLSQTNHVQYYQVLESSGAGPFTLTLDRPLLFPYDTVSGGGTDVRTATVPTGIRIDGRGMSVSGTGDRAVSLEGCWDSDVSDVRVDAEDGAFGAANAVMVLDTGCLRCSIRGCVVEAQDLPAGPQAQNCFRMVSGETCALEDCQGLFATAAQFQVERCIECVVGECTATSSGGGFALVDCDDCEAVSCFANGTGLGAGYSLQDGCARCTLLACEANFWNLGILVSGSNLTTLDDCVARGNLSHGVAVADAGAGVLVAATKILNLLSVSNSGDGLNMTNSLGVEVDVAQIDDNSGVAIAADRAPFTGRGLQMLGNAGGGVTIVDIAANANTVTRLSDLHVREGAGASPWIAISAAGLVGSDVIVENSRVELASAGAIAYSHTGGSPNPALTSVFMLLGTNEVTQAVAGCFGYFQDTPGGTGTLRRLSGRHDLNVTTPITINSPTGTGPGSSNIGSVAGNVNAGAYFFPDLKSTDHVNLTRRVNAGVPGVEPTYVATPGVGVTITPAAGDDSTFSIQIDG